MGESGETVLSAALRKREPTPKATPWQEAALYGQEAVLYKQEAVVYGRKAAGFYLSAD